MTKMYKLMLALQNVSWNATRDWQKQLRTKHLGDHLQPMESLTPVCVHLQHNIGVYLRTQ